MGRKERKKPLIKKVIKSDEELRSIDYSATCRVMGVLDLLRNYTDETESLNQIDISAIFTYSGDKYSFMAEKTLRSMLRDILYITTPANENNRDYPMITYNEEQLEIKGMKDLRFNHPFSFEELDALIRCIYTSNYFIEEERNKLIVKLAKLSSLKYQQKWISNTSGKDKVKFDNLSVTNNHNLNEELTDSLRKIETAIRNNSRITVVFNEYDCNGDFVPQQYKNGKLKCFLLNPYHIAMYNGRYYLIANKPNYNNLSIWRIDLMTDVKIQEPNSRTHLIDSNYNKILSGPNELEKFMGEHLNMCYGKAEEVELKLNKDKYTALHDAFGSAYTKKVLLMNNMIV